MPQIPPGFTEVRTVTDMIACDCCDEPFCELHQQHYADCPCLGPTQDDVEYLELDGVLYGRRTNQEVK